MKINKRRMAELQATIENVKMNAGYASSIALAIWEEWTPKGMTQDEIDRLVELLIDAKIQADMALECLEQAAK